MKLHSAVGVTVDPYPRGRRPWATPPLSRSPVMVRWWRQFGKICAGQGCYRLGSSLTRCSAMEPAGSFRSM